MVPDEVGKWFKQNRESYSWPTGQSRQQSEESIDSLSGETRAALASGDTESLKQALVNIRNWENNNRRAVTNRYRRELESKGGTYLEDLLSASTFNDTDNLEGVVRHLEVRECNLPTCTAIASFLYGRKSVPIVDTLVAQFFAGRFSRFDLDSATVSAIQWIEHIAFKLEDPGNGRLRLAVYKPSDFESTLELFIHRLVPECERISQALSASGHTYDGIDSDGLEFTPVDVEMATFSWSSRNQHLFG